MSEQLWNQYINIKKYTDISPLHLMTKYSSDIEEVKKYEKHEEYLKKIGIKDLTPVKITLYGELRDNNKNQFQELYDNNKRDIDDLLQYMRDSLCNIVLNEKNTMEYKHLLYNIDPLYSYPAEKNFIKKECSDFPELNF